MLLCWLIDISGKRSLVFAEILHSIRNLKTEKVTRSWFSPKNSCLPKLSFFISHKVLVEVTSNEECQFRFSMHTVFLGRCWYTRYSQYVFIQLDFRILWSAVSLEVMLQFIWFIAWVFQSRKSSMWVYYFWLGVARHIQSCPNLPGLTSVPLGSLWGISW